jgi:hypothetical protein
MLPVSQVHPVELVALPHPTHKNKLVMVAMHDSAYFATAVGYPELRL